MIRSRDLTPSLGLSAVMAISGLLYAGCSNDNSVTNPPPDGDPGPALVSDPVALGGGATVVPAGFAVLSAQVDFSFTAFLPGEYPGGETAEILNQRTEQRLSAPMLEGGLDPVGIPAEVGDVLEISVLAGQTLLARWWRPVPSREPPVVVRTQPPDGKTKVPLNLSIVVVFSEPVDGGSVTPESFDLLRDGEPVPGEIQILDGGLRAEFTPDEELLRSTEYTIALTTDVDDLSGDPLEAAYEASFTTDNPPLTGKIVFEGRQTGIGEIYFMNPDGTGVVQVTDRVDGGWSVSPSVSSDGTKIAFSGVSNAGTVDEEWDIYTINVDGTDLRNLTDHPAFDGWRPTWSPDGSQVAFFSNRDDPLNADIYVIGADGSGMRRFTTDPANDANPSWSPDGSRIAFASDRGGGSEIWVMNVDGTGTAQVTDGRGGDWPAWSPDGTEIAFDTNGFILRVTSDGTQYTELSAGSVPAWSPDGSMIAFNRVGGEIYLMNADGTDVRRVSSGLFPSWGP